MKTPSAATLVLLLLLGGAFVHFMAAGARTFSYGKGAGDEAPANIASGAFLFGGTLPAWMLGLFYLPIRLANGLAAAALMIIALALYEWARHTVWRRGFGIAWDDHVPEQVCAAGPYRWVRHPLYLSYLLAFLAVLVALPHWLTAAVFVITGALFVHGALDDERRLAGSALAADYAVYRERTGMFLPKLSAAAPGKSTP